MLVSAEVTDEVLGRGADRFANLVVNHAIINMATTPLDYSLRLEADMRAANAEHVEALCLHNDQL